MKFNRLQYVFVASVLALAMACQRASSDASQSASAIPRKAPEAAPATPVPTAPQQGVRMVAPEAPTIVLSSESPKAAGGNPLNIRRLAPTKDGCGIIATRADGSHFVVYQDAKHSFLFNSDDCSDVCTKDLNWAILEWADPSMLGGSLGGRIETNQSLLSVKHHRLLGVEDLGFPAGHFFSIRTIEGREVVSFDICDGKHKGCEDRQLDLSSLDALIEANIKPRPHGRK